MQIHLFSFLVVKAEGGIKKISCQQGKGSNIIRLLSLRITVVVTLPLAVHVICFPKNIPSNDFEILSIILTLILSFYAKINA